MPTNENNIYEMRSNFYNAHAFAQCIYAIDGRHVGVKRSLLNTGDFINKKRKYTLNIQAAADYSCFFFSRESVHDAHIFLNSKLNTMFREGVPNCSKTIVEGEPPVLICILGDVAYLRLSILIS